MGNKNSFKENDGDQCCINKDTNCDDIDDYVCFRNNYYRGNTYNDIPQGYGILYDKDWRKIYEGQWAMGQRHGEGIDYHQNGKKKYEGTFCNNKYHGTGTLYYSNGNICCKGTRSCFCVRKNNLRARELKNCVRNFLISSTFDNNAIHYQGIAYYKNGNIKYKGECSHGNAHGYGVSFDESGQKKYEGDWLNNAKNGHGISYYENSAVEYDGLWKNNLKDNLKDNQTNIYSLINILINI